MNLPQAHTTRSGPRDRDCALRRAAKEYLRLLAAAGYTVVDAAAATDSALELLRGLDRLTGDDAPAARILGAGLATSLPGLDTSARFVGPLATALLLAAPVSPADVATTWSRNAGHAVTGYAEVLSERALGQHEAILRAAVAAREHRITELQDRLHHAATHDRLTGLVNRAVLEEWIAEPRPAEEAVSVLLVDLDGFKQINDTHGHRVGDELLVAVAERLRAVARPEDCVCRYGGDEFVIATLGGEAAARENADRILTDLAQPFTLSPGQVHIQASIGIATATDETRDAAALIHAADRAMYAAKSLGGHRYRTQP
ncbi:diguanylate cyclase domain-containing protein [Nocardia sp. NPDC020380]|uniref:diguanylate cyclase domain-containing protein n=1 Tax=Nocardia sp. NPDC020380 TaxID=3364309 RepID=UPI0037B0F869